MVDTFAVDIVERKVERRSGGRILRPTLGSLYLLVCALAGSGIAEHRRLAPLAHERGLSTSILLKESFRRFDAAWAAVGLLAGTTSLVILVWASRARSAD
jgi:hypothetical protein